MARHGWAGEAGSVTAWLGAARMGPAGMEEKKSKRQLELEAQGMESFLVEGYCRETEAQRKAREKLGKPRETYSYMLVKRKDA